MTNPETKYVKSGDVNIVYQVVGAGCAATCVVKILKGAKSADLPVEQPSSNS